MAEFSQKERWHFVARAVVSLIVGIFALGVIGTGQPAEAVKWATGTLGVIVGYWLR